MSKGLTDEDRIENLQFELDKSSAKLNDTINKLIDLQTLNNSQRILIDRLISIIEKLANREQ